MDDKQQLLQSMDQIRSQMANLVETIDPELEICPGWTIKEVLGHITAWEIVTNKAIKSFLAGESPYFLHEQDFDLYNQAQVKKRTGWTLDEVIREWKVVRAGLKKTLADVNAEDLEKEMVTPWGSERSIQELFEIAAEHEEEHAEGIRKKQC
ncbi:MAG: DinB family protein [Anaerolineales bacterium]